jgi:hypothetical protein
MKRVPFELEQQEKKEINNEVREESFCFFLRIINFRLLYLRL